jgi:hypothetical protein
MGRRWPEPDDRRHDRAAIVVQKRAPFVVQNARPVHDTKHPLRRHARESIEIQFVFQGGKIAIRQRRDHA